MVTNNNKNITNSKKKKYKEIAIGAESYGQLVKKLKSTPDIPRAVAVLRSVL